MSIGLRSPKSSSGKCDYCTPDPGGATVLDDADVRDLADIPPFCQVSREDLVASKTQQNIFCYKAIHHHHSQNSLQHTFGDTTTPVFTISHPMNLHSSEGNSYPVLRQTQ
ncbi:hypothetical protein OUZ56_032157 [Daphnia magna]|uniref:Uncharacterized protein n=1 Tax=Daphnia magna TaxID=35525 RepID=A0ABQ9ZWF0_9CRUS|nr:hypothetical protein OUZ56_032157 [Daphnia magna]